MNAKDIETLSTKLEEKIAKKFPLLSEKQRQVIEKRNNEEYAFLPEVAKTKVIKITPEAYILKNLSRSFFVPDILDKNFTKLPRSSWLDDSTNWILIPFIWDTTHY